jgi:hypothetical protein
MEVNTPTPISLDVKWESTEKFTIEHQPLIKLKDFINTDIISLKNQLVEKDYILKFNNNTLSKILLNNQVKDLISKFHGNRIDISVTNSSVEEINNLRKLITEKQEKIKENAISANQAKQEYIKSIDFEALGKKMQSLVIPITKEETSETEFYFQKVKRKIVKRFTLYDKMFGENEEVKTNLMKAKIAETFNMYNKIINHNLEKVIDFFYKYAVLFLNENNNDNELHSTPIEFRKFCDCYNEVLKNFVRVISQNIRETMKSESHGFNQFEKDYDQFLLQLEKSIVFSKAIRYLNTTEPPSTVFFSFDTPVQLNFSEVEYQEIKSLLQQFPDFQTLRQSYTNLSDEEFNNEMIYFGLERDVRIYQLYGVKMEEFVNGYLLFEN